MRFSANLSLLFTEVPMAERFELAKQAGFDAVELQFPYEWPAPQLKQWLDEHDLRVVLCNVGEGLAAVPHKQMAFREALAQAAAYAAVLQPDCINILPGRCYQPEQRDAYWQCLISHLRLACEVLSPLAVTPVFEAINTIDMPGFLVHDHGSMMQILSEVDHPALSMQYDIYHMAMMMQDIVPFWQQQIAKIAHIQFADCPGRHQPGTGQLDFAGLFAELACLGYPGYLGAEYRPLGTTLESLANCQPKLVGFGPRV